MKGGQQDMKINGVELSLDVSNPEELTAASRFIDDTRAAIAGMGGGFLADTGKVHRAVSEGFDRMYGLGIGALVCGEKASGMKAVTAVCEFMEEYWRQLDHMEEVFKRTAACWERFDREAKKMGMETPSGKQGNASGSSADLKGEVGSTPFAMIPQEDGGDV